MNLFRSEEHARNWSGFANDAEGGLLSLAEVMAIFSAPTFRERLNGRYISARPSLRPGLLEAVAAVTQDHPFWGIEG